MYHSGRGCWWCRVYAWGAGAGSTWKFSVPSFWFYCKSKRKSLKKGKGKVQNGNHCIREDSGT